MEAKGFVTYTMRCDNCGNVYESEDGFPERQLCPRCMIVFKAGIKEGIEYVVSGKYMECENLKELSPD